MQMMQRPCQDDRLAAADDLMTVRLPAKVMSSRYTGGWRASGHIQRHRPAAAFEVEVTNQSRLLSQPTPLLPA